MSSAYFVPLLSLPAIISSPGKYVTRRGDVVTITATTTRHKFGCAGTYPCGVRDLWHKSGRLFASRETANDIIKAV